MEVFLFSEYLLMKLKQKMWISTFSNPHPEPITWAFEKVINVWKRSCIERRNVSQLMHQVKAAIRTGNGANIKAYSIGPPVANRMNHRRSAWLHIIKVNGFFA